MRRLCSILALSLALAASPALAQQEADLVRFQTAMDQAQAQAARQGDEALTCEQMETEMVTMMDDPAVKDRIASMGATAQNMQNQAAEQQRRARAQMAVGFFTGLASSFIPGAGMAQGLAMQGQVRAQQAQAAQNQAQMMSMMNDMIPMMPMMMRGQHLYELGQTKQCAFTQQPAQP